MNTPFDLAVIGAGLPFASAVEQLSTALARSGAAASGAGVSPVHDGGGPAAVVQAPPGTGKTTLVPPVVANLIAAERSRSAGTAGPTELDSAAKLHSAAKGASAAAPPRVLVTQPRRVASRAAARRLAQLSGSQLGDRVGYSVRGERCAGPRTEVEFLTPGILLRRLLADPELSGVDAVILDEVHERALDSDLLFGMLAEVRILRPDLRLVVMSATLDAGTFSPLLGDAPVVDCPAVLHPLDISYAPAPGPRMGPRGVNREFLDHVAEVAAREHQRFLNEADVDALVFVPGAREVEHVAQKLAALNRTQAIAAEIILLMGQSSPEEQNRAVSGRAPGERPRIIVSTSLAESSLTVPGVRLVIDSGLAREPRRDAARGMNGLVTVAASRASSQQRAGRAARLGPGRAVRCCEEKAFAAAPAQATPEIAAADLTQAALFLACWGSPGGVGLPLPSAPPRQALEEGVLTLQNLGALAGDGSITHFGRTLAGIPADPRLARALLSGAEHTGTRAAAEAVALLSLDVRAPRADLPAALREVREPRHPHRTAFARETERFTRLIKQARAPQTQRHGLTSEGLERPSAYRGRGAAADSQQSGPEKLGTVVALAFPAQIARAVPGQQGVYLLASGSRAALPAGSSLNAHEWLAVAEASRAEGAAAAGTGAVIRAAAPLHWDTIELAADHLLTDEVEAEFEEGRIRARRVRRLGAIMLDSTPVKATAEQGRAAVLRALSRSGMGILSWDDAGAALRSRLAFLYAQLGEPWPDVSDAGLLERAEQWLGPELSALAGGKAVTALRLAEPLRRLLPWPEAARLDELAPERLPVPSGSKVRITYPEPGDDALPVVAVKLQECFGWAQTPRLAAGRVPVQFHLLSPAGRPLAVTSDLASFWAGPYAQVRAEMRGKYPRHPWPEDPWSHVATAKTKRRLEG